MVRENRIKELRYTQTVSATTTGSYYSAHSINGIIQDIDYNFGTAGSLTISASGGETILGPTFKDVSGASVRTISPVKVQKYADGTFAAGSPATQFSVNGPIKYVVTGGASGAKALDVVIRYI